MHVHQRAGALSGKRKMIHQFYDDEDKNNKGRAMMIGGTGGGEDGWVEFEMVGQKHFAFYPTFITYLLPSIALYGTLESFYPKRSTQQQVTK